MLVMGFIVFYKKFQIMNSVEDLHNLGNLIEDFVCKKDLKRKCTDVSINIVSKKPKVVHSLDYQGYKDRVATFSDPDWSTSCNSFTSSCCLLPHQLARYGWVAKNIPGQQRFVQCVSCKENLYLKLPEVTSSAWQEIVTRQEARVTSQHAEFCPWSSSPSPVTWSAPVTDTLDLVTAAVDMLTYNTDLPWIKEETFVTFKRAVDIIVEGVDKTEISDKVDVKVKQTAALLSLLGWRKGKLEDTLCDTFQVRRVGLWNFQSIQSELDRIEDIRVARELSGDVGDGDSSPKKKELEGKKYFDPLKEHLAWNPMILKDEDGKYGWETVLDSFDNKVREVSGGEHDEIFATPVTPVQTVLSKVRALLDLW